MYQKPEKYAQQRSRLGISEDDINAVMKGPDDPDSVHHPGFDHALSSIIDAAIMHARSNGGQYWRPYLIEQWACREEYSRMEGEELQLAKKQINKISQDEKNKVLLMYVGRTKRFKLNR